MMDRFLIGVAQAQQQTGQRGAGGGQQQLQQGIKGLLDGIGKKKDPAKKP